MSRYFDPGQLALVETLAIGCHAVYRGNPQPDEKRACHWRGTHRTLNHSIREAEWGADDRAGLEPAAARFLSEKMGVKHTVLSRGDGSEVEILKELTNGVFADPWSSMPRGAIVRCRTR